jgi:ribosomal protein L35
MPKNKKHKGLLKRIRLTATGKVRHRYLASADIKRFEKLLFRRLRGRTQPKSAMRISPSPAQRKAAREAKAS